MEILLPRTIDEAVSMIESNFSDESVLACDTETYGFGPVTPFSIQIGNGVTCMYINLNRVPDTENNVIDFIDCIGPQHIKAGLNAKVAKYYNVEGYGSMQAELSRIWKALKGKVLVFHYADFDFGMLKNLCVDFDKDVRDNNISMFCTMRFYRDYVKPGKYEKLVNLCAIYKTPISKSDMVDEWFTKNPDFFKLFYKVPVKTIVEYACLDVMSTYALYMKMLDQITEVRNKEEDVLYTHKKVSR